MRKGTAVLSWGQFRLYAFDRRAMFSSIPFCLSQNLSFDPWLRRSYNWLQSTLFIKKFATTYREDWLWTGKQEVA